MVEFRADLHCHTTCSDGTFSPGQLLRHASDLGLSAISITDHDTIAAYHEAIPIAMSLNLPLISGVEFSTEHKGVSVHVLAYAFHLSSPIIHEFCINHSKRRKKRAMSMIRRLEQHGMRLTEEDLLGSLNSLPDSLGRPHIAQAMVKKRYVRNIQEAFAKYLGEGQCCFEAGEALSVEETLNGIHAAGGKAVLAHPHLIDSAAIVDDLLEMNFDGIEVYYARFNRKEIDKWMNVAKQRNWLVTGGSDFHGSVKENLFLGCSWAPFETYEYLHAHFLNNEFGVQAI